MFSSFRQRINIKYFMVAYLVVLLLGASVFEGAPGRFLSGLTIVALYAFFDLAWTRVRDRVWYLPVSSWISALVLANVGPPAPPWWILMLLPLVAVAGKQLLHLGKSRHVFNPAGFALLVLTFFSPVISWWTVSMNVWMLILAGAAGLFILWRQERFHVAIAFLFVYTVGETAFLLMQGTNLGTVPFALQSVLWNGPLIFFMTVMLIEPVTSNFPTRGNRIVYGIFVGVFSLVILFIAPRISVNDLDPLVAGLLFGNLAASLLFLKKMSPAIRT